MVRNSSVKNVRVDYKMELKGSSELVILYNIQIVKDLSNSLLILWRLFVN